MTPDDLVEFEQIKRVKYRYLRCVDQKRWDELATCFVPESTASYASTTTLQGREAILEFLTSSLGDTNRLTSHKCSQPEIELVSSDSATATWALQDVVILGDVGLEVRGAAFYDDRYVRRDGVWHILHTEHRRIYEELYPRASIEGLELTAHFFDTDGRSRLA